MPETTRRPLIEVAKRYRVVACVSGRRASDARRIVSLGSIAYLGSHGSEVLRPGSTAPELDRELQAWSRRVQKFSPRPLLRAPAPPARPAGGQGGDRRPALARRARRGRRPRRRRGGRRRRRGGRVHLPLGPQGARDPPAGADRQGRRHRRAAARHRARGGRLRRRRRRPTSTPSAASRPGRDRAACSTASGSGCSPTSSPRRCRTRPTTWSTARTASATCCGRSSTERRAAGRGALRRLPPGDRHAERRLGHPARGRSR